MDASHGAWDNVITALGTLITGAAGLFTYRKARPSTEEKTLAKVTAIEQAVTGIPELKRHVENLDGRVERLATDMAFIKGRMKERDISLGHGDD